MRTIALLGLTLLLVAPPLAAQAPADDFRSERITVVTRGNGPDLILIPGLGSHRDVWAEVADVLDDRYRLHLVQLNGFAGAPARANATGPVAAPAAEEIARYIRAARLTRPAMIGHSMGGTIAMMLAARHPDLVGRLMIEDMTPFLGLMAGSAANHADSLRAVADLMRDSIMVQGTKRGMLRQTMHGSTRVERHRAMLERHLNESHVPTMANAFHEMIVTDLRPELARIAVPVTVLYIVPAQAPMPPDQYDAMMRTAYSTLRNGRVVRIEGANHFIHFDQPDRFIAELDAFMRR